MLRCLAIDDEPLALELLEDNIRKVPFLQLVASSDNALEALNIIQQQTIDLVFVDIQMPGLTGLQLIQTIQDKPMFILVTAYEKYALEGYSLDVVDYLVKPVPLDRFIKACNKAHELFQLKLRAREHSVANNVSTSYFFVPADYSMVKIDFDQILYIEGLKDYVKIHLLQGKPIVSRLSFKSLEEQLPPHLFFRIHKSFIISAQQVTAVKKSSIAIAQTELPVGEAYREVIQQLTGKK